MTMRLASSALFLLAVTPGTTGFAPPVPFPTVSVPTKLQVATQMDDNPGSAESPSMVLEKDFRLMGMVLGSGAVLSAAGPLLSAMGSGLASAGLPIVVLAGLFGKRTSKLKLELDDSSFGFSGVNEDNRITGTKNRWDFDKIVNYEFFPKGWIDEPQGPMLFYFKEVQTPRAQWNVGPGALANSPEALADGAVPGQIHWMPAMFDTKRLQKEFERRGVANLQNGDCRRMNTSLLQSLEAKIESLEAQIASHNSESKQGQRPALIEYIQDQSNGDQEFPRAAESSSRLRSLEVKIDALEARFASTRHEADGMEELQNTIQNTIASEISEKMLPAATEEASNAATLHIMDYPKAGSCGEMKVPKQIAFLAKAFGRGYVDGPCSLEGYTVEEGTLNGTGNRDKDKTYTVFGRR